LFFVSFLQTIVGAAYFVSNLLQY